ncbi:hypothetical protein [Streptomyces maremycinicus]|nr:hypothetical protein [Streptomyces sp. NBRC 110468]
MPGYVGSSEIADPFLTGFYLDMPGCRARAREVLKTFGDDAINDESAG